MGFIYLCLRAGLSRTQIKGVILAGGCAAFIYEKAIEHYFSSYFAHVYDKYFGGMGKNETKDKKCTFLILESSKKSDCSSL